ncbi:MAG TPA: subclass B3 metallo-beta-lactamase [Cyclobacteriaceae bacterium]|jgi:metallo-beta-lactamase class B|nr:subclass B3 metallo-beta-lactamase [Cyclobacteriaceae bacterium]
MLNFRLLLSLSLLVTSALASLAQGHSYPYYDSSWSKPYEPFRIAGNLYYVGSYDLGCYLITTPNGHVLINSGLKESVSLIRKNVEALGFKFTDIKILLNTQAHYDHVAGLAEIKKITGAKMMVHEGDSKVLADGGHSDFIFGNMDGASFAPVTVDRILHDRDTIQIGGTQLLILHHPGHTKGSTSFLVDVKDEKRSWKVLIVNIPSILSETKLAGMPSYPNVGKDYQYTFEALKKLQFDLWVASHAGQFKMHNKRKPGDPYHPEVFIDRKGYDELVNRLEQEYTKRLKSEQ